MNEMKSGMLRALSELRKTILDETVDLNIAEVRTALAQFLNSLEAYLIEKKNW